MRTNFQIFLTLLLGLVAPHSSQADPIRFAQRGLYSSMTGIEDGTGSRFLAQQNDNRVHVVKCVGTQCTVEHNVEAPGRMWASAEVPEGIVVAFGFGRNSLEAPVSLVLFDKTFATRKVIYERKSERAQISYLKFVDGKLWLSFFTSKYDASAGFLQPGQGGNWEYSEVNSGRLEDTIDVSRGDILIGRAYGGAEGQDGDARIRSHKETALLPTYRGVRAVKFLPNSGTERPGILLADGWHQNYGKMAQARISFLQWNPALKRYGAYLLQNDQQQYGYSRFLLPAWPGKSKGNFIAVGNRTVELFGAFPEFSHRVVATAESEQELLDAAIVGTDKLTTVLAVFNGTIDLVKVVP